MITIHQARASILTAAVAVVVGASLSTTVGAAQATPVKRGPVAVAAAETTHENTLTPEVRRLAEGSGAAAEAKALSAYWTGARMRAAVALDREAVLSEAQSRRVAGPQGWSGSVEGAAPTAPPSVAATAEEATARTIGTLFFSRTVGSTTRDFACSGAIVNTPGKSAVWTSGRCVYDYANGVDGTRVWDSNATFVPAYSHGRAPYGFWYSRTLRTTPSWAASRNLSQDNGAVIVSANTVGRIADHLGAQGLAWNVSNSFTAHRFVDHQYVSGGTCPAGRTGSLLSLLVGRAGTSTGTPWLRDLGESGFGLINGHDNGHVPGDPERALSPYYGNQVGSLYSAIVAAGG